MGEGGVRHTFQFIARDACRPDQLAGADGFSVIHAHILPVEIGHQGVQRHL